MAMILDAAVSKLSDMLVTAVKEDVVMLLNVRDEINKLSRTLVKIQNFLVDAERKRIEDKAINDWLIELKDVMYDADDILDECWIKAEKKKAAMLSSESSVRCHLPLTSCFRKLIFTHAIGRKITSLTRRLEEISADRAKLNLSISSPDNLVATTQISRKRSPVLESDIVGTKINEDTRSLVESLTARDDEREKLLVFGITGIGGVGKTTLAQKVFNDDKIKVVFPIKIWLSVSQEFNEIELLREIITSVGGDHSRALSKALLEPIVESALRNKRFLLVLDDVWNDNVWHNLLRNPLQGSAVGSRVLVTTRNEGVVKRMKVVRSLRVELLPPEDGWSLLCEKVVLGGDEGEIQGLKDIGMQIVGKCDGLPLAIITVGGLLCVKERSRRAWQQVLDSTEWSRIELPEGVQAALYLSYMDLPSHLKQCFLYCSLFKEDDLVQREDIYQYWIAEGFIKAEGTLTPEATAEEYYGELVRRCLLQPDPFYYGDTVFKVHDLLRSLAQFLARDESLYVGEFVGSERNAAILGKLRRLSIVVPRGGASTLPDMIMKHGSLRTLFLSGVQIEGTDKFYGSTKVLRVLHLDHVTIEKLPPSIGDLIHLRLLYISNASITELPDRIGDLINLQFLTFEGCMHLRSLPKSIVRLRNLRYLIDGLGTPLEGMPVGLGRLQDLRILTFSVNSGEWCSLEELRQLPHLRCLFIENIQRAVVDDDARGRGSVINTKQDLERLELRCSSEATDEVDGRRAYDSEETERIQEVLELVLSPPPCVEMLSIEHFFGLHLPSWIAPTYLPNLRFLELFDCMLCQQFPSLGMLPNLDHLHIKGAPEVTRIGPEFLGQEGGVISQGGHRQPHGSSRPRPSLPVLFPKLEALIFQEMPMWEVWQLDVEGRDGAAMVFPCLTGLALLDCPSLRSLPLGFYHHATSLTLLAIYNASRLEAVESLASLKSLKIYGSTNLESVSELSTLEDLEVRIDGMEYIPRWLFRGQECFPALRKLHIIGTAQLLQRCLVDGPDWPAIEYILNVHGRTSDGSYYFSYTKSPFAFTTNLYNIYQEAAADVSNAETAANAYRPDEGAARYTYTRYEPLMEWVNRHTYTSFVYRS